MARSNVATGAEESNVAALKAEFATKPHPDAEIEKQLAPHGRKPDGTPRLRAVAEGPRVRKPVTVLAHIVDAQGNKIEGAQLNVIVATNDSDKLLEAMDKNPGASRFKITFDKAE